MARESSIIVPIEGIDPIVGPLRSRYDPAAVLGVPTHITLLYPFHSPPVAASEIESLARLFVAIEAFEFSLIEVRRFTKTAYLHPDKSDKFVFMTRTLTAEWPDCRPYNGAFTDVIPHLTVADQVDASVLDEVENLLAGELPLRCIAREAWLLSSDAGGRWSKQSSFPFSKT